MSSSPRATHAGLITLLCGLTASTGCGWWDFRGEAIRAVAAELSPSHTSVAGKFETVVNPRGQGIVVLVRSETSCYPKYSWIRVSGPHEFLLALDAQSQMLTPGVPLVDSATAIQLERMTTEPSALIADMRTHACKMASQRQRTARQQRATEGPPERVGDLAVMREPEVERQPRQVAGVGHLDQRAREAQAARGSGAR